MRLPIIILLIYCLFCMAMHNGVKPLQKIYELKGTWVCNQLRHSGLVFETWEIINDSLLAGKRYEVDNSMRIGGMQLLTIKCDSNDIFYQAEPRPGVKLYRLSLATDSSLVFTTTNEASTMKVGYRFVSADRFYFTEQIPGKDTVIELSWLFEKIK